MADRKLPELRTRIRLDTSDLDKADARIAKFTRNFSDPKAMAGYQARLKGIGDQADEVGSKLTRNLTLPIAAAGAVSVKLATDFNKSFTTMTSLAGVTADELEGLKDEVKDLARETGRSPQDLAEALYFLRSSGLEGTEAMEALEASARGAAIGLGDTAVVADAASSAVNAYGSENLTAAEAVDQLAAAVAAGKGEAAAFAPQIGQLLPLAKALGVEFSEVAGAMAYFTQTGTPAAQAATMVQGVLQKLVAPSQQAKEAFEDYGITLGQLQATVSNKGLLAGIELLNEKVGGNREVLAKIFDDVEGRNAVFGFLNDAEGAAEVLDQVANSAETVNEAFARVQGTDEFKAQQAIVDLQVAAIELGETLIPLVADLAEGVSGLANGFSNLPGPVQKSLLVLVGVAALLGPMAKGLYVATTGIGLLLKAASSSRLDGFRLGLMGITESGAGASNAIGGLIRTMGPAGIGVAAGGIAVLSAAFIDMQVDAQRAEQNIKDLVSALEAGQTPAEAIGTKLVNTLNGSDGGFANISGSSSKLDEYLDRGKVGVDEITAALIGSQAEWEAFQDSLRERLGPVGFEFVMTNLEKFRGQAERSNAQYREKQADLKALGIETENAADSTGEFTQSQVDLIDPTSEASDELKEQADVARSLFDAHQSVADAADAVADAQAELADAQRAAAPGSEENRRALEAVADAEEAVRDAQAQSLDAQRDLTDARKEAAENLEDLAIAASGAQVAESRAALDLEKAKVDLLKASTPLEVAEAKQRIAEAEQALLEARDTNGDSAQALADAQAKGIEGSDAVVAAQERITAARDSEREAQGRLAAATRDAAQVQAEANARVQEASERLTDAELDQIEAQAKVVELTDGAAGSTDLLIDRLSALAAKLDPSDPLRKNLESYLEDLRELRNLESGDGINNTGRTGGAPEGVVVSTGQITGGDSLDRALLPSPGAVSPAPKVAGDTAGGAPVIIQNDMRFEITGQPDAATLAALEALATRSVDKAMRKVVIG